MELPQSCVCYSCNKPAKICYTEVDIDTIMRSYVCDSCPLPSLYYSREPISSSSSKLQITLECGGCKTIWQPAMMESITLGCHSCYMNFKTHIVTQLLQENRIFSPLKTDLTQGSLHVGRTPGESANINPLIKLIALNEALQDTLAREDYEQAALLRDQINCLKKQSSHDTTE